MSAGFAQHSSPLTDGEANEGVHSGKDSARLHRDVSDAIIDGGLPYEMADDGGSAIWMAKIQINHVKATSPKPTTAAACRVAGGGLTLRLPQIPA